MRRRSTASLIGSLLLLAFAGPAAAKGDAMAALDTPIPPDADPGTELEVGWRAWTPDGAGEWPFAGSPVFIRLTSPDGQASTEVMGLESPRGSGHYLATIRVPTGGIGLVQVGLLGESCVDGRCTRSDILFELPEDQRLPVAPVPVGPPPDNVPLALAIVGAAATLSLLLGQTGRVRATSGPAGVAAPAHAGLRRPGAST